MTERILIFIIVAGTIVAVTLILGVALVLKSAYDMKMARITMNMVKKLTDKEEVM